jgi:hypothetical protein
LKNYGPWISRVKIGWSVRGVGGDQRRAASSIDKAAAFINGDDQFSFSIDKGQLTVTGDYQVILRMYAIEFDNTIVY